jgi:hypothetical protein
MICGEEARFLDVAIKPNVFMVRKCMAARFLSPLIDILYRSTAKIQDQPLHLSLQLHFIPYLRTNSLHQRLGIAIVLNCWARMFRRAYNAQKQQVCNVYIVQMDILFSGVSNATCPSSRVHSQRSKLAESRL